MMAGRSNHWAEYIVGMKGACRDYVRMVGRHESCRSYHRRSLDYYARSSLHGTILRTERARLYIHLESGDIPSCGKNSCTFRICTPLKPI